MQSAQASCTNEPCVNCRLVACAEWLCCQPQTACAGADHHNQHSQSLWCWCWHLKEVVRSADGHPETLRVLQVVELAGGATVPYDKICICSGATPKAVADHPAVIVLRDSDSVQALSRYTSQWA